MGKTLYINVRDCHACGACQAICPEVFDVDEERGYAQVKDCPEYPEDKINEAILCCSRGCIEWDETPDQFTCQKYMEVITEEKPKCKHPKDYCKFRQSCPIVFKEKGE